MRRVSVVSPRQVFAALAMSLVGVALIPAAALAQSCQVNGAATCIFGNTAGQAITLTITPTVRLATSTTGVALAAATASNFDAGFGAGTLMGVNVRSITTYTVSLRATTALWGAVGAGARPDRPAADLQWGTLLGGPYTDMTTSAVSLTSGVATGGTNTNLYLRGRYTWVLDSPGDYSLTVQLTLTAP